MASSIRANVSFVSRKQVVAQRAATVVVRAEAEAKEAKAEPKQWTAPTLDPNTPSPIFGGSTGGLLRKAQVRDDPSRKWLARPEPRLGRLLGLPAVPQSGAWPRRFTGPALTRHPCAATGERHVVESVQPWSVHAGLPLRMQLPGHVASRSANITQSQRRARAAGKILVYSNCCVFEQRARCPPLDGAGSAFRSRSSTC